MENRLSSEQIEAEICRIIRVVAHKHGAEVTFNFDVEQNSEYGLTFSAQYDVAWKRRRHLKFCIWALGAALAIHCVCATLCWLKIVPLWVFWIAASSLFAVSLLTTIYVDRFAPKLANPDRIYREARNIVHKKFGKTYNTGFNQLP